MEQDIKKVKNLMFDLGGVIMDIKRANCIAALEALGLEKANEMLGEYVQSGAFGQMEEGRISADDFFDAMRAEIGKDVSNEAIRDALNAFLLGIPVHRLRLLEELRKHYGVYLLSNTNPIMFDSKIADEFAKDGKKTEDYFDGMVKSYETGYTSKPDVKIYQYAIDKFGFKNPSETLFFDDSQINVEAARSAGFQAFLVKPGVDVADSIRQLGLI